MPSTALLIIDVQRVLGEGPYAAHDIDATIARINAVARRARAAGLPVVVIQHETVGAEMDHGSEGWQLDPRLEVAPTDLRLRKRSTDSFHQTELQALLQARGVDALIVCGLQSDFCVDTTTRRALALGYPVTLVSDGHSTLANGVLEAPQIIAHHNRTLSCIESFGVRATCVPAAEVLAEAQPA